MNAASLNLVLVTGTLQPGGSERVMSIMASYWAAKGWPVTLVTLAHPELPCYYPLDPAVRLERLNFASNRKQGWDRIYHNLQCASSLRKIFAGLSPDVIISFLDQTNILTIAASRLLGIATVVSERVHLHHHAIPAARSLLRDVTYPFANRIVVQSEATCASLPMHVRHRGVIIPNPVPLPSSIRAEYSETAGKIVAMGRLVPQKGFDLLIRAFAAVAARAPTVQLEIWGEGPSRDELEQLARDIGVARRVTLAGLTRDSARTMAEADIFVLSSRFEGFPNVLLEAMAVGLPVIAFDCPAGPAEIVRHGDDGLLVPAQDVDKLSEALARLIDDRTERRRLGVAAKQVRVRFSVDSVMARWERLLFEVVGTKRAAVESRSRAQPGRADPAHSEQTR